MTSTALSDRLNVSDSYLKKIIKALVKEGLVNSSTGKMVAFLLNKPLNQITFYDVFQQLKVETRSFLVTIIETLLR